MSFKKLSISIFIFFVYTSVANAADVYFNDVYPILRPTKTYSATNWSNNNIISSIQLGLGGGNSINGSLGPIKIYNNALNPNQVQRNYNALKSRFGL
jgi:hypothetical protein